MLRVQASVWAIITALASAADCLKCFWQNILWRCAGVLGIQKIKWMWVQKGGGVREKQIRGFDCGLRSTYINKQWEALGFQLKYKQAKVLAEYSHERPEKQYDCKRRVQSECFSVVWATLNMQRQKPKVNEDWIYIRPEPPLQKDCCLKMIGKSPTKQTNISHIVKINVTQQ